MGDSSSVDVGKDVHWTPRLEEYFAQTGEKASGLAWVHKRCEQIYNRQKTYIDLPVAIGSAITGFISVGSTTMFAGQQQTASIALGAASLLVSILNTVGSYYGWAKRAEGHRISAIHYAKLYRFLAVELTLPRDERMTPTALLKYVKDQYDRLAEVSPLVPDSVVDEFRSKFSKYTDVSKPEETNGLHKIEIYADDRVSSPSPFTLDAAPPSLTLRTPKSPTEKSVSVPVVKVHLPTTSD
jgi:hypothetical protein